MKHLVAKEHHTHLKKRAVLELAGLLLLISISISQRELVSTALETIRSSDVLFVGLLFIGYWFLLPFTAISYRLLAHRPISIRTTILAQMAGAGPGRIIPGGLGHISIGAVHLRKSGLNMQRAVLVTVTNNLMGLFINMSFVIAAVIYHPSLLSTIRGNISFTGLIFILLSIAIIASLLLWASHARKTRGTIRRVNAQWHHMVRHLTNHPVRLLALLLIAVLILFGHVGLLLLAGKAIGLPIDPLDALIALSAGVFIGGALPTPGGIGAVEAGTISTLVLLGYDPALAAGVAVLFRMATYWQPLIPGIAAYLYLREKRLL